MGIIYVAASKALQAWASDVGLGKNVYQLGYVAEGTPEDALANGLAGETDWKVIARAEADAESEDELIARLARKEKRVDPAYYPRLKAAAGIFKVNLPALENSMRVRMALDGKPEPKNFKVKPADIGEHLIRNALK